MLLQTEQTQIGQLLLQGGLTLALVHALNNIDYILWKNRQLLNHFFYFHARDIIIEPRHEIFNNVVCVTSKGSDQPAHTPRLIRAFASQSNIL